MGLHRVLRRIIDDWQHLGGHFVSHKQLIFW